MLKITNLNAAVDDGQKQILNGLSLDVPAGEVHAIMGPNGAGKSTLAYVLTGRDGYEVTGGEVTLDGEDVLEMDPEDRAQEECHVLLLETVGTKNNGTADVDTIYDAPVGEWI